MKVRLWPLTKLDNSKTEFTYSVLVLQKRRFLGCAPACVGVTSEDLAPRERVKRGGCEEGRMEGRLVGAEKFTGVQTNSYLQLRFNNRTVEKHEGVYNLQTTVSTH